MNLKMSCLHLKKNDVDNHDKLKSHLNQAKTWAIHQFIKDKNGIDQDSKELFPQIPSILVVDFFASNSIDELNMSKVGKIFLKATGLDNIQWSYILISTQSTA